MENPNSSDDKNNTDTQSSVTEQIQKYILENLLSVIWSASLLGGGLIFWFYFFQIQYFPDLSFADSSLILPLAAITGIFFLLLMAALLMTPYFFRWMMLKGYDSDFDGKDRQNWGVGELIWYFFSIYLAIFVLFIKSLGCDRNSKLECTKSGIPLWISENSEVVCWTLIIVILVGHAWCYICDFGKKCISKIKKSPDKILLFVLVSFFSILTSLTSVVPLIILIAIEAQTESFDDKNLIILLAGFYFIVMMVNGIYAYFQEQAEKRKWWCYLIPFLALLGCFYWAKDPIIPKMVMKRFQLGGFTVNRLVLDEVGCTILKNIELKSEPIKNEKIDHPKKCFLENIKIQSRLGRVFLLEQKLDKDHTINFNIPKEHVLSWSKIGTKKKTETCPKDGEAGAS